MTLNARNGAPLNSTNHRLTLSSTFLSIPTLPKRRVQSYPDCTLLPSLVERTGVWARLSQAYSSLSTNPTTPQHKWFVRIDASPTSSAYHTPMNPVVSSRPQPGSKTIHTFAHCTSPYPSQNQNEGTPTSNSNGTKSTSLAISYHSLSPIHQHQRTRISPGVLPVC